MSEVNVYGSNWTRVRHVPTGNTWHPATDSLEGSEEYGDSSDDNVAWSVKFDHLEPYYFKFATGDNALWLIAHANQVYGEYDNSKR